MLITPKDCRPWGREMCSVCMTPVSEREQTAMCPPVLMKNVKIVQTFNGLATSLYMSGVLLQLKVNC